MNPGLKEHTVPLRCDPPGSWQWPEKHLRIALEHPWFRSIVQLQDAIHLASTQFFKDRDIKFIFLPITTGSVSSPVGPGSDSLPVCVNMFGRDVYLADSMQFLLEYGTRRYDNGVWYVLVSFRGDDIDDRHLTEFSHVEVEIPGGLEDIIILVEAYLQSLTRHLLEHHASLINQIAGNVAHLERILSLASFPRVRFEEARSVLVSVEGALRSVRPGVDVLTRIGEQYLMQRFGEGLWVTHFPAAAVPFYQKAIPGSEAALCADLLLGAGEVVGSGERHASTDEVLHALSSHGLSLESYMWYVEMKRIAPKQTAGFGMGIERFLLWVTNTMDIRNFQLVLRYKDRNIGP